jgi:hypothetical protein
MVTAAGPALAAPTSPKINPHWYEYRGVHKTDKGQWSGDWVRCNYVSKANYTQVANCSQGKTVSLSISETYGFTDGQISAAVGFSVSYSSTVTAGNSVTIKPGGYGWFDVGFRYHRYTIGDGEAHLLSGRRLFSLEQSQDDYGAAPPGPDVPLLRDRR